MMHWCPHSCVCTFEWTGQPEPFDQPLAERRPVASERAVSVTVERGCRAAVAAVMYRPVVAAVMYRPVRALRPRTALTLNVPGLISRTDVFFVDFTSPILPRLVLASP